MESGHDFKVLRALQVYDITFRLNFWIALAGGLG